MPEAVGVALQAAGLGLEQEVHVLPERDGYLGERSLFLQEAIAQDLLEPVPRGGQSGRVCAQAVPCAFRDVPRGADHGIPAFASPFDEAFRAVGGGDAGLVGHLVEEAPVDLVPDSREHGDGVVRYGAAQGLAVEKGEVRLGTPAADDADDVNLAIGAESFQCLDDARLRLVALHLCEGGHDMEGER